MSVIRKTPYIEQVINSLTTAQKTSLKTIINSSTPTNVYRSLIDGVNKITNDDLGVKAINVELDLGMIRSGFLIYNNTYCVLIAYHSKQDITLYKLDIDDETYDKVDEYCTIEELRRTLVDVSTSTGDAWVESMKTKAIYDETDEEIQVGVNTYFDGNIKTNGISTIKDEDGNTIIPDAVANKILIGNSQFAYKLETIKEILGASSLASNKTYVLKCVNGTLTWVEES